MLCDDLEGSDGVGSKREVPDGEDIYTSIADSLCCIIETKTTL